MLRSRRYIRYDMRHKYNNVNRQCWFNTNKQHSVCKFLILLSTSVMLFIVEYIAFYCWCWIRLSFAIRCLFVCFEHLTFHVSNLYPNLSFNSANPMIYICLLFTLQRISISFPFFRSFFFSIFVFASFCVVMKLYCV